jgi:hypothetical protein
VPTARRWSGNSTPTLHYEIYFRTSTPKTIAGTIDKSSDEFRPWHARTFQQEAYQRIGIALQRGIISDQIARAHARRMRRESASGILLSETEPLFEGLGQ